MSDIPDASQRKAIYAPAGQSVLVTAPPGYGKTYVMPRRIEYLIKSGALVPPERALGLTFTNAAASEMIARLEQRVSRKYLDYVDAMTFHSLCYQVLRAFGNDLSLSRDFRILPEGEKRAYFRAFVEKRGQRFMVSLLRVGTSASSQAGEQ
jgi:DNA helicase-2/ATP-dependent DNA helicase PcrA